MAADDYGPGSIDDVIVARAEVRKAGRASDGLPERDVVEGYGGRVIYSSGEVVFSSTQLMAQIQRREEVSAGRLEWLCERHEIDRSALESIVRDFPGSALSLWATWCSTVM